MARAIIVTSTSWFTIDVAPLIAVGVHFDRKFAKIKYSEIRSLNKQNNDAEIEIVFSNGEIKKMSYDTVTVDGVDPTDQNDFFNKMDAKIFPSP